MANATEKQVRYALVLLNKAGYRTDWMAAEYKALGATMAERSGTVTSWLEGMDVGRISGLIKSLLEQAQEDNDG